MHRFHWFKAYVLIVGLGALLLLPTPATSFGLIAAAAVPGYFLYQWNRERRTARLIYDIDNQHILHRLSVCNAVGEALAKPERLWHIYSSQLASDRKRNAGASSLIRRTRTACRPGSLPGIELNIEPWSVSVGPQQLVFLPDCILVHENRRFATVPYEQLVARYQPTRFIEEVTLPTDSRQVDTTWKFVNKSGGRIVDSTTTARFLLWSMGGSHCSPLGG